MSTSIKTPIRALLVGIPVCLMALAGLSACSDDPTSPDPGGNTNPNANSVNEFFSQLAEWPELPAESLAVVGSRSEDVYNPGDHLDYRCGANEKEFVKPIRKIASAGMDEDVIWPGAILQGKDLSSGIPKSLGLPRSPITLRVNLAIENQSRVVEEPNSVSVGQAIADLISEIATQQGTIDPVRSNIQFQVTEASSFEQSMLSMGVGGGFKEPYSGINLEGNIEGSVDRSQSTHSAVVQLSQEMFTISFADDLPTVDSAAELFGKDVDVEALEAAVEKGDLGDENLPVYVKSVTYGRLLIASIKSTSVESGGKLAASVGASYEDYGGSGNMSAEQREILESSSWQYTIFGGSQEAADNAIGSLDWSQYFTPTLATTAVPLRFELRTVADREPAGFQESVTYEVREDCQPPRAYEVTSVLERVELASGSCIVPCTWDAMFRMDTGGLIPESKVFQILGTISNANRVKTPNKSITVDLSGGESYWTDGRFKVGLLEDIEESDHWAYPLPVLENRKAKRVVIKITTGAPARRLELTFKHTKKALY